MSQRKEVKREIETACKDYKVALFLVKVIDESKFYFLRLNNTAENLFGLTKKQLQNLKSLEIQDAGRADLLKQGFRQCVEQGEEITYKEKVDLSQVEVEMVVNLIPECQEGQIVRIVGSAQPVSSPESELKSEKPPGGSAEPSGRTAVKVKKSGLDGIALVDESGDIFYVNDDFVQIFGLTNREEVLGKNYLNLAPGTEEKKSREFLELIKSEGLSRRESRELKTRGKIFDVEFDLSAIQEEAGNISCTMVSLEDITESRQREIELSLAWTSVDNAPLGIFWLSSTGKIEFVNNKACEMLNFSRNELKSKKISDIDPEYSPEVHKQRWQKMKSNKTVCYEAQFISKNEKNIPVQVTGRYTQYKENEYEIAFVEEITERKQREVELIAANQQLAATEQQLRAEIEERKIREKELELTNFSVENSALAIFWIAPTGEFKYVNEKACKYLNYSKDELIGKKVSDIDPDFPAEKRFSHWEELQKVKTKTMETSHETKEGNVFPVEVVSNYLEFEGQEYEFAFVRDITERKQREQELRKLNRAIMQSPSAVVITDKAARIEFVNPAFEELTGYEFEEVKGENPRVLQSGEHADKFFTELWETITSGRTWRGEFRNKKKNGSLYWEDASIAPVKDENDYITHFIKVAEDITAQKQFRRQLEKLNECFVSFGDDPRENINQIVKYAYDILGGANVIYNRLEEGGIISTLSIAEVPEDYKFEDNPEGHICYDVIRKNDKGLTVFEDLQQTNYPETDPNVKKYNLKSYIGFPVEADQNTGFVGAFCLVDDKKRSFKDSEKKIMQLLGRAISTEEKRMIRLKELENALAEKVTLIQEVHHRVKNNLQVIHSLLSIQQSQIEDTASPEVLEAFESSCRRVLTMAEIHNQLYTTKHLSSVVPADYIRDLTNTIVQSHNISFSPSLEFEIDVETELDIDTAIPCGLILNELISNALEHAFGAAEENIAIKIEFKRVNNRYCLRVIDSGCGLNKDFDMEEASSLGLIMVKSLTEGQLQGEFNISSKDGTEIEICFPIQN